MVAKLFEKIENTIKYCAFPANWHIFANPRFLTYSPTYEIDIETSKYKLQTAKSIKDLSEIFKLRHDIFLKDDSTSGYDIDAFDSICDHIMIKEAKTGRIIGTYRLIGSTFSQEFYSQTEFELEGLLDTKEEKLELGRACIHDNYRNGSVIDLLWRGIGEYAKLSNARYLFGCSSIKITDPTISKGILEKLKNNGHTDDNFNISPTRKFYMNLNNIQSSEVSESEYKRLIPPLLKSYLAAGCKIYGEPALDKDFKCVDFFTILDINNIHSSYRRRYFKN